MSFFKVIGFCFGYTVEDEIWSSDWPISFKFWKQRFFDIEMPWTHSYSPDPSCFPPLEGSGNQTSLTQFCTDCEPQVIYCTLAEEVLGLQINNILLFDISCNSQFLLRTGSPTKSHLPPLCLDLSWVVPKPVVDAGSGQWDYCLQWCNTGGVPGKVKDTDSQPPPSTSGSWCRNSSWNCELWS